MTFGKYSVLDLTAKTSKLVGNDRIGTHPQGVARMQDTQKEVLRY